MSCALYDIIHLNILSYTKQVLKHRNAVVKKSDLFMETHDIYRKASKQEPGQEKSCCTILKQ